MSFLIECRNMNLFNLFSFKMLPYLYVLFDLIPYINFSLSQYLKAEIYRYLIGWFGEYYVNSSELV